MIALDTNVIVRVVTQDDPWQARVAEAEMRNGPFFVPKTVLVEVAWVLQRAYGLDRATVSTALRTLVGIETAVIEDRDAIVRALAWHQAGLDFADAVHLASSDEATALATLDRRLRRTATKLDLQPPVRLAGKVPPEAVPESRGARSRGGTAPKRKRARGRKA